MRHLPHLPRNVIFGFGCWYLAGLGWLGCLIVPFTNIPHKGAWFLGLLIVAESSFALGLALLGRAYYRQIKDRLVQLIRTRFKQ